MGKKKTDIDIKFDFRQSTSKNSSFECCVCVEAATATSAHTQHLLFLAMVSKWGPVGTQDTGRSA